MGKIKAAFFDRDGTLIEDMNYLDSINKIRIIDTAVDLCIYLQSIGYKLFIVTNQSGVARGFFDEGFVIESSNYLENILAKKGVFIERTYFCPHLPPNVDVVCGRDMSRNEYFVNCTCRKPNPGLILQAARDFDIDLEKSLMFGDKISDINAGLNAGCKSFLIQDFLVEKNDEGFEKLLKKGDHE